jgi:branched-chain amino acid transport system ATP-binding protein
MAILEIEHIWKLFGGLAANTDVSFAVEQGSIVGLIGPNGAGKTTLFGCLTGYHRPSRGQVIWKGARIDRLRPDQVCRRGVVRTWQKVRPLAGMSVVDNVIVGALVHTNSLRVARQLAEEQLAVVKLGPQAARAAGALSIGERKRLEVARALATRPGLLLLDEVMGGLNATESDEIIQLILELKQRGLTQIVIEHDMRAIMRISDRIVVLSSGQKLAEGTAREIADHPEVIAAYLGRRQQRPDEADKG